jgi:hypothetical protein
MPDIKNYAVRSGRILREDNSIVNEADGINADGSRKVSLTGSLVPLGSITTNTVITPGSFVYLVNRSIRKDYKTVRGNARLTASAAVIMRALFYVEGNASTLAGSTDLFNTTSAQPVGEARLDSHDYAVYILNNSAGDITVQCAQVIGVK